MRLRLLDADRVAHVLVRSVGAHPRRSDKETHLSRDSVDPSPQGKTVSQRPECLSLCARVCISPSPRGATCRNREWR